MNSRMHVVAVALGLVLATALTVVNADSTNADHVVVVRKAQSLEQIVQSELRSTRFVAQIATYNGLDDVSSILPVGTSLQIPKPYMGVSDFGRVAFVKGDVMHTQTNLVVNPPPKGAMVLPGDIIATGEDGFISLSFTSGATVNIQPASRVSIVEVDCVNDAVRCVISLNADRGKVHSEVTPRPDGQPALKFDINTPFLSAAVRGTAFYVNVEEGADRIGVTSGLVAANAGGTNNDLPRGKGLLAVAGVEPVVVDLLPAPSLLLSDERVIVSNEDSIDWAALDGAMQYQYTVASDESFSAPITVEQTQGTTLQPNINVPGQYYFALAGMDEQEFKGLPATAAFHYASIDDNEPLELAIERSGRLIAISSPDDHNQSIELVISNSIAGENATRRLVDSLTQGIELELDPSQDWVFQARKVFSETSVSTYSNQYLLEAIK